MLACSFTASKALKRKATMAITVKAMSSTLAESFNLVMISEFDTQCYTYFLSSEMKCDELA
jgi:hypothetical protein